MIRLPPFTLDDPQLVPLLKWLFAFYVAVGAIIVAVYYTTGIGNFGHRDYLVYAYATNLAVHGDTAHMYAPIGPMENQMRYPPSALLFLWPLGFLPPDLGWLVFISTTAGFLVWVVRKTVDTPLAVWATLGSPAVAFNSWTGQSAMLYAALMGASLLTMRDRPLPAGISCATLACKPTLFPLLFLAQIMTSRKAWLMTLAAIAAGFALTTLLFGFSIWHSWLDTLYRNYNSNHPGRILAMENHMASPFAVARLWGANLTAGFAVQGAVALLASWLVVTLWRDKRADYDIKAASLPIGTLLLSPYLFYYDFALILPALAFWARHVYRKGHLPLECHLMGLVWLLPAWVGLGDTAHMTPLPQATLLGTLFFFKYGKKDAA